jgi:YebC/PmpR family DNA-binding regulatory protein
MAGAAARGKVFTKHARLIEIAAREGGGDSGSNAKLRAAIEAARGENVPNANIDRAIKKGTGELKGEAIQEVLLEAYGPAGTAYLIECLTDNKNRTLGAVRAIVAKQGGRLAEGGAVAWQFERKGVVVATSGQWKVESEQEGLQLELIDFGAEDIEVSDRTVDVTTDAQNWANVRDFLKEKGFEIITAGLKYVPKQKVEVPDVETAKNIQVFMDAIEEDDDVSEVHTNADISEEIAKQLS